MKRPESIEQMLDGTGIVGALCCECGTFRPGPAKGRNSIDDALPPELVRKRLAEAELSDVAWRRDQAEWLRRQLMQPFATWVTDLKCATCGTVTQHAKVAGSGSQDQVELRDQGRGTVHQRKRSGPEIHPADQLRMDGFEILESRKIRGVAFLCDGCKVVLIKEGITEDERRDVFRRVLQMIDDDQNEPQE